VDSDQLPNFVECGHDEVDEVVILPASSDMPKFIFRIEFDQQLEYWLEQLRFTLVVESGVAECLDDKSSGNCGPPVARSRALPMRDGAVLLIVSVA